MYRFYAAEVSYFSAKVRPALRYKAIHYAELLPDYANVIVPRTGLAFIPVLVTPENETLQDTSDILDELERRVPVPPLYPTTPVQRIAAYLWELYADEILILPAMHYRWDFPESEAKARGDFAAFAPNDADASRFADRMKGTRDLLDRLSAHLAHHASLLGERMSLADCALMGPLYAHLYLDAVPGRLLRETAPRVCRWIERMNHPDPEAPGEWLAGDVLAPTMRPLLELIGRDAAPILLDTLRSFENWADTRPPGQEEPPRGVGGHETRLRGVRFQRYTSSYTLWMAQRLLDAYRGLAPEGRAAVNAAFAGTGCEPLLAYAPRHRLAKRDFRLVLVP
jgi:glutathione S-transferase